MHKCGGNNDASWGTSHCRLMLNNKVKSTVYKIILVPRRFHGKTQKSNLKKELKMLTNKNKSLDYKSKHMYVISSWLPLAFTSSK